MKPIRWLIDPKPLGLDPSRAIDGASQRLHGLLYETLAERWDNGRASPAQIAEIKSCLDGYRNTATSAFRASLAALNPSRKLEFKSELGRSMGRLHYFVTTRGICVSPPSGEIPQASGTYLLARQTPDRWFLEPRTSGRPSLELVWIGDEAAKLAAMRSGEIDLAMSSLSLSKTRWLMDQDHGEWISALVPGWPLQYIALNTLIPPFDDIHVRRSLRDAINRDRILNTWLKGFGQRRDTYFGFPAKVSAPNPTGTAPASLSGVSFTLRTSPDRQARELAQILRAEWQTAGAEVGLEVIELGLLLRAVQNGKVPIFLSRWLGERSWAHLKRVLHSSGDQNRAHYSNPQVDQWIDRALNPDTSQPERARLATQVHAAWERDVPYILLWTWKQGLLARRAAFTSHAQTCLERWNSPGAEWKSVLPCLR